VHQNNADIQVNCSRR